MFPIFDSLQNLLSGLGVLGRDKAASATWVLQVLTRPEVEAMFRSDWIARKVVKVPAEDMSREGRRWVAEETVIEAMEREEKRLGLTGKVFQGVIWARLYGGSGLVLYDGATNTEEPLNVEALAKGGLKRVVVLPRHRFAVDEIEWDIASEWFGGPKLYTLTLPDGRTTSTKLHPSRVIQIVGEPIPDVDQAGELRGWGDSALQAVVDAIRNAGATQNALAALIEEAKVDVFSIPNLTANVGTKEYRDRMTTRWTLAQTTKSTANAMLIDKDEEWDQRQISFTGIPDVLRVFLEVVAGASDIPATRLVGTAPKGLNATGEGDLANYYDMIRSAQTRVLGPIYERLDPVVYRSATGANLPEDAYYEFNPLTQVDDETAAKIAKLYAETAQIAADAQLAPPDAIAEGWQARVIEDGVFPGFEAALEASKMELGETLVDPNAPDPLEMMEAEAEIAARHAPPPANGNAPRRVTVNAKGGDSVTVGVRRLGDAEARDAKPKPLYVSRRVLNAAAIIAHFKGQGFESLIDPADMHVTITFSRAPVDWFAMGTSWSGDEFGRLIVRAGGPRLVEPLGQAPAVLLFASEDLNWRHDAMIERGASWDHDGFTPHITLTYGPVPHLAGVEPWKGEIVLGPEIFEEIDDNWTDKVEEA